MTSLLLEAVWECSDFAWLSGVSLSSITLIRRAVQCRRSRFPRPQGPARGRRVEDALRASLRDGFASLDPASTRKGFGAYEDDGHGHD